MAARLHQPVGLGCLRQREGRVDQQLAAPGLEQEFFDAADAFAKWCNSNGGINGYQIVVDKLDAKLFNGGAEVIQACQRDFMLVGGGNALDAADVKPY